MCGFILWMSKQYRAFWKACPSAFLNRYTIYDQVTWTKFLQAVADGARKRGREEEKDESYSMD